MKVDVTTEIDINRPRAEVAAFAADPDNTTTWYQNIKAVRWETPKPVRVGSRIAFEARFLGRSLAYTYERCRSRPLAYPVDWRRHYWSSDAVLKSPNTVTRIETIVLPGAPIHREIGGVLEVGHRQEPRLGDSV